MHIDFEAMIENVVKESLKKYTPRRKRQKKQRGVYLVRSIIEGIKKRYSFTKNDIEK